jgi:hypothetical protein
MQAVKMFLEGTALLKSTNGPKAFLNEEFVDNIFFELVTNSINAHAANFDRCNELAVADEFYTNKNDGAGWIIANRAYYSQFGIVYPEFQ